MDVAKEMEWRVDAQREIEGQGLVADMLGAIEVAKAKGWGVGDKEIGV